MIGRAKKVVWRSWWILSLPALAGVGAASFAAVPPDDKTGAQWIGTWATAPQPQIPGTPETFRNQTLRLIVHTSAGGKRARIKISNTYGERDLTIGAAHIALRQGESNIDPRSDRPLKFQGQPSVTIHARSAIVSDAVDLNVPALADVAVSLFFPETVEASTCHLTAKQTSYVSQNGDFTAAEKFPVSKNIRTWPFLTGLDIEVSARGFSIVAFGSSLTDGDGSTRDKNRRWPDALAERLQKEGGALSELGVLNEGIIGNRLLEDSPEKATTFGRALGEAGIARFDRDVLSQSGVKYAVIGLGINDIAFPGSLTPQADFVTAEKLIAGYRQLIERAHKKGIRVIGTTNPAFEDSFLQIPGKPNVTFFTPEKEAVRKAVNIWILNGNEFDGTVDFDAAVRDPQRLSHILASFDSGDHLHPNDLGYVATANLIPLALFTKR